MSVSAKAVSMGDSNIEKAIQIYKVPLEDMGYNFDATIINTIKVLQNAGYTALSATTMKIQKLQLKMVWYQKILKIKF